MTTLLSNLKKASLPTLVALLFAPAVSAQTLQPNRDETYPIAISIPMGEGPVIRAGVEILQVQKYHEDPEEARYDRILREAAE
ncbi:hypothetical protein [Gaoshiqia sediminis]|uniref:Uncharacterized protein n=1 Tax=Gaoshiqia sediminis TaxID=2986998 RepID=A0AA42C5J0_9BACT|nr:hypothetical protein [Gaoshiqia sediminis]MCW0481609.1 hypothetical protein [Gaoshiqia sediminis]